MLYIVFYTTAIPVTSLTVLMSYEMEANALIAYKLHSAFLYYCKLLNYRFTIFILNFSSIKLLFRFYISLSSGPECHCYHF